MTPAQTAMYFAEWGKLRDVLRARGWSNAKIETHRHEITKKALGRPKSSKAFTNADLDAVLAKINAERDPAGFDAQMRIQDSPERARADQLEACHRVCWEMFELGDNGFAQRESAERYIAGTARNVVKKSLADCTAADLAIVCGCLARKRDRMRKATLETTPDQPF